jgi:hypothetical protein
MWPARRRNFCKLSDKLWAARIAALAATLESP